MNPAKVVRTNSESHGAARTNRRLIRRVTCYEMRSMR